ncbi:MAG: thioesterase [Clostridia bacterium]|nr:thioesterase [Clostridia bacterium]
MFTQNRTVTYSHLSPSGEVGIVTLLQYFQDCATAHTTAAGYPIERLASMDGAWILNSMHLLTYKPIRLHASIHVSTWTSEFRRAYGIRSFRVTDAEDKETYAEATSLWVFCDTKTGHPKRIIPEIITLYGEEPPAATTCMRKEPQETAKDFIGEFKVLHRDLDTNNHMNNAMYVSYAMEALQNNASAKEVDIYYKHPAFLGEKLSLYANKEEDKLQTIILNEENQPCAYIRFTIA